MLARFLTLFICSSIGFLMPIEAVAQTTVSLSLSANDPQAGLYQQDAQVLAISIEGQTGVVQSWRRVCAIPCQVNVDPHGVYKVGGEGLMDSRTFQLPAGGPFSLTARVGHRGAAFGGIMLVAAGSLLLIGGAVVAGMGAAQKDFASMSSFFEDTRKQGETMMSAGGIMVGLSPLPIITGIVVLLRNRTLVHIAPHA